MLSPQLIATPRGDGALYALVNFLGARVDMQRLSEVVWEQID